ncbi:MAG: J domain-containing protein [Gemmataceae bacterium]
MKDPYQVLGLPGDADDETIRRRYLELVKRHPPGQDPERFAEVRRAYEQLRDLATRVRHRLFEIAPENDSIEKIAEELACRSPRRRVPLKTLLSLVRKPG